MWLVEFLPAWIIHLVVLFSLLALAASLVLTAIPFVGTNARAIQAASAIVLMIAIFFEGAIYSNTTWQARVAELELKIARAQTASAETNARLQRELSLREREIAQAREQLKDRIKQQAAEMDSQCRITPATIDILNDAARAGARQ